MRKARDRGEGTSWKVFFDAARQACDDGEYAVGEERARRALAAACEAGIPDAEIGEVSRLLVDVLRWQGRWDETAEAAGSASRP
jgi:hypothetical protein